jgi:signal transduction histidine kinase
MTRVVTGGTRQPEGRSFRLTLSLEPGAVTAARHDVTEVLAEFGLGRNSAFSDAVLLVVSELVTNVVRHALGRPATADVTVTAGDGELVIAVEDHDPRLPDMSPQALGAGLRTVAELAAEYGGALSAVPLAHGAGKAMRVHFVSPDSR